MVGLFQPLVNGNQVIKDALGGDVFKRNISELPEYGYIDLKTIGKRISGEFIDITLSYQVEGSNESLKDEIQIHNKQLSMELVSFHSVTSVSVVLASPIGDSDDVKLTRKYQVAPAASLLLKLGSRKSKLWNNISPGIGIIMATPDMDLDGSPDVSFGGSASLFRDVLSLGVSYNTRTDSGFYHIGLSLPFNVFGGVQNTSQLTSDR